MGLSIKAPFFLWIYGIIIIRSGINGITEQI